MSAESPARPRWFTANAEGHSQTYAQRFRDLAASGSDIVGEARLLDAMLARGSRVLDAGCGGGRIAGALHAAGHDVVGLDVDEVLVEAAVLDHPGPRYGVVDLSRLALSDLDDRPVDAVVAAGNVMIFLAPGTERQVLENLCAVTRAGGRVVLGFRRDDAYPFEQFEADLAHLAEQGVAVREQRFATWHLDAFTESSDYAVTVLRVL